jgi:hypothetical protein
MTAQEDGWGSSPRSYVTPEEIRAAFRRDSDRLEQLRRNHPNWRIWNVPTATAPATWHAEPGRYPLDAHTADELEEYIREDDSPPVEGLHTSSGC